jgi:3-carboxy-cis,cis-muconate cycloisomerase
MALTQVQERGGSFIAALGRFGKTAPDEKALLGYSPQFVDRLLADLKRRS